MKKYFSTLLPPPNLTGVLHLGHMWNAVLQDTLMRFYSSKGIPTYWGFGLDHAGISLQVRVESELRKKGIRKRDLDPKEFQEELWSWKDRHAEIIRDQYRQLGYLLPFDEERFTLDEGSLKKSLDTFRKLYSEGLVYRAEKLVNWDSQLKTAISDIEVMYRKEKINLYYIKYHIEDSWEHLVVATTRPETMFGDSALFVNPQDQRYSEYIGRNVTIPFSNRKIKVLGDEYVDMEFGTGVMKCTPAHDFQDYQLALKHNLEFIKVFDSNLRMLIGDSYAGLHRDECRSKLVEDLEIHRFLERVEPYESNVSYSERSGSIVEPLMSNQWFVRSSVLAKRALEHWKNNPNEMMLTKQSQEKILESMLLNMEDWCISRQLDWGISIPVWINEKGEHSLEEREGYEPSKDVLDTWFSSSLWPLTVFENRKDLLPLSVLISGKDILLFWISRMVFMSVYLENRLPFKKVFLHGLVLDSKKRKMSKSLNNGIDPLELKEKYGNDVVRLFFLSNTHQDSNIAFSENKLEHFSKFLHKLKNAYSFLKAQEIELDYCVFNMEELNHIEKWIYGRLGEIVDNAGRMYGEYRFSFIANDVVDFVWDSFCNRYLEFFKLMRNGIGETGNTRGFMSFIWTQILHLLEPLIPEYSRKVYADIYGKEMGVNGVVFRDLEDMVDIGWFMEYVTIYESIRKNLNIPRGEQMEVNLVTLSDESHEDLFPYLGLLGHRVWKKDKLSGNKTLMFSIPGRDLVVEILANEYIVESYMQFVEEKKKWLNKELEFLKGRLTVGDFSSKAPKELVEEVKLKIEKYKRELKFYP